MAPRRGSRRRPRPRPRPRPGSGPRGFRQGRIGAAGSGSIFVGTDAGLHRFTPPGAWERFTVQSTESGSGLADGLGSDIVTSLATGPDGVLWIGGITDFSSGNRRIGGLTRLDPLGGAFQHFVSDFRNGNFTAAGNSGLLDNEVLAVTVDAAVPPRKWIGTRRGLALYKGR